MPQLWILQPGGPSGAGPAAPGPAGAPARFALAGVRAVLDRLAAGRSDDALARALFVSSDTVRNTVSAIYAKLHAPDRAAAIIKAREAGLGRA